jgi:translation initiation factor RLI1
MYYRLINENIARRKTSLAYSPQDFFEILYTIIWKLYWFVTKKTKSFFARYVEPRSIMVIMGPNGYDKLTMFNVLTGKKKPWCTIRKKTFLQMHHVEAQNKKQTSF